MLPTAVLAAIIDVFAEAVTALDVVSLSRTNTPIPVIIPTSTKVNTNGYKSPIPIVVVPPTIKVIEIVVFTLYKSVLTYRKNKSGFTAFMRLQYKFLMQ